MKKKLIASVGIIRIFINGCDIASHGGAAGKGNTANFPCNIK